MTYYCLLRLGAEKSFRFTCRAMPIQAFITVNIAFILRDAIFLIREIRNECEREYRSLLLH